MIQHRLLLGPVFIALVIAALWLDGLVEGARAPTAIGFLARPDGLLPGGLIVLLTLLVICALGAWEIARFTPVRSSLAGACVALAAILGLLSPIFNGGVAAVCLAGACATMLAIVPHAGVRNTDGASSSLAVTLFAFVFLGLLPASYVLLRASHSEWTLVAVILTIKACDIGAYFTGRAIGRRRLIPWLSPGKTWEGLAGGVLAAAAVGALLFSTLGRAGGLTALDGVALGACLALVGQAGDLAASFLKRAAGVKDSGRVPGFGGVLDLVDSPMLAGPVALALLAAL